MKEEPPTPPKEQTKKQDAKIEAEVFVENPPQEFPKTTKRKGLPKICWATLIGVAVTIILALFKYWDNKTMELAQERHHQQGMEMRDKEFEALDRRAMVKLALDQLKGGPEVDADGNPVEYDVGKQALREWALNTFNDYNKKYPITDPKAQEYLKSGKGGFDWGNDSSNYSYTPSLPPGYSFSSPSKGFSYSSPSKEDGEMNAKGAKSKKEKQKE